MSETPDRDKRAAGEESAEAWEQRHALAQADIVASVLVALAIAFCAGPLFRGLYSREPRAFIGVAPLVGAVFFVAMITMFAERKRKGLARVLLAGGAAVLAFAALFFVGVVPAVKVLLSYWVPALLAMVAALVLFRGHQHTGRRVPVRQRVARPTRRHGQR